MGAQRAADGAERERHLELAFEGASPSREAPRRERARSGRERAAYAWAPASTARQSLPVASDDGVDAVHDALVVRRGAVRIELGEARRERDAARDRRRPSVVVAPSAVDGDARA